MADIFRTENLAFKDMIRFPDITVPEKSTTFVVGRNGSGKSTLFKLFNRTLSPSAGRIWYNGNDLANLPPLEVRREVLLVSQQVFLFDTNIRENFEKYHAWAGRKKPDADTIQRFLDLCNADFDPEGTTRTLSGGERQRVYIAVYLSLMPTVLLLDEPTAALDKESAGTVMSRILDFCGENKITSVVISHDEGIVKRFAAKEVRLS